MCKLKIAMQMEARTLSASRIQRLWRRHLEHKRFQAVRQDPIFVEWRAKGTVLRAHLLQKVISVNMSLVSAFWHPKQLHHVCLKAQSSCPAVVLACQQCVHIPRCCHSILGRSVAEVLCLLAMASIC